MFFYSLVESCLVFVPKYGPDVIQPTLNEYEHPKALWDASQLHAIQTQLNIALCLAHGFGFGDMMIPGVDFALYTHLP